MHTGMHIRKKKIPCVRLRQRGTLPNQPFDLNDLVPPDSGTLPKYIFVSGNLQRYGFTRDPGAFMIPHWAGYLPLILCTPVRLLRRYYKRPNGRRGKQMQRVFTCTNVGIDKNKFDNSADSEWAHTAVVETATKEILCPFFLQTSGKWKKYPVSELYKCEYSAIMLCPGTPAA